MHHFFYAHKPWAPWARCPEYLTFLDADANAAASEVAAGRRRGPPGGGTRCHAILAEKRRCLAAPGHAAGLDEAACKACAARSGHTDRESRAQLEWACRQPPECPRPWDVEWEVM